MPKKIEKRGKPRDKWANYTAVVRRSERAWKAYMDGSTEYSRILKDLSERVGMIEKKLNGRRKENAPLQNSLITWKTKMATVKKKAIAKRKKSKMVDCPSTETSPSLLSKFGIDDEHMLKVVAMLEQGGSHPIFTLLKTEKAALNPSVEVALELKNGKTLCVYKHALENVEKGRQ